MHCNTLQLPTQPNQPHNTVLLPAGFIENMVLSMCLHMFLCLHPYFLQWAFFVYLNQSKKQTATVILDTVERPSGCYRPIGALILK